MKKLPTIWKSPQVLESEEFKYQNIYQSGYFRIDIDLKAKTYSLGEFVELDYGFDFYAPQTFEFISEDIDGELEIYLRSDAKLTYKNQILSLKLDQCGYGRNERKIKIEKIDNISIYSDTSSVEIFINNGEYVMTSRLYSQKNLFKSSIIGTLYEMDNIKWEL